MREGGGRRRTNSTNREREGGLKNKPIMDETVKKTPRRGGRRRNYGGQIKRRVEEVIDLKQTSCFCAAVFKCF